MSSVDQELPETRPRWEIPSDWKWVSIADVGKVITGNTPPTKDESNYGNFIPFVKPPALTDKGIRSTPEGLSETGVRSSRTLPAGAVLVSCIGGLGKTAIAKVPVAFNQQINAIVFDQRVIPEFGFYYAQTLKPWLHGAASATTLPIVNKGKFQQAPFPLAPLDQQRRIIAEIEKQFSRLDEAVANLKRVKANLKRYKAAVLKAAVEGRLVETEAELARREGRSYETGAQLLQRILETRRSQWQGKGKYKEPAAPDTTNLPALPEGWVWTSVGCLGDVIGGLTKNPKRAALPRKLPYLRVANVYANELRLDEITEIGVEDNELEKLLVKKDDLLIVEGNGSPDQIGRLAIWDGSISPCVHQNHLIKVRLPAGCSPKLVVSWLSSPEGRNCVRDVASSTSGLYTLSVGKVSALPVPLPPISEQLRIIEEIEHRLSLIDGANAQVNANLQRATRMRQSILACAFTTGLSVDVHLNPAYT